MNKNLKIFGIIAVLVCIGLSGCFKNNTNNNSSENGNGYVSNANLIMTDWQYEAEWDSVKGDYINITLFIMNNGTDNATAISVTIYSTNQDNLLEANKTAYLLTTILPPNEGRDVNIIFDYEPESIILYNKITIRWYGGIREYFEVINL